MLKIRQLQKQRQEAAAAAASSVTDANTKVPAAQLRLQKDITELDLPPSITMAFPNPGDLFHFNLTIKPQTGYYKAGTFHFTVEISPNFPIDPPKIKCDNKIYHPNIDIEGNVCLNILRSDWSPALSLNAVIIGLNFLFLEPNPNDPLNKDAANVLVRSTQKFADNVTTSMRGGRVDGEPFDVVV
ncbi:NEDD8-conjugating enzyme Ubc12p [Diutina catenulata]